VINVVEILDVLNNGINEYTLIFCTKNEDNYAGADIVKISDSSGDVFETSDFGLEKFTECFSPNKTITIVTKSNIPEKFLTKGNKVELIRK
jgi:aspartate carbamoyltransferase regulatory subunit